MSDFGKLTWSESIVARKHRTDDIESSEQALDYEDERFLPIPWTDAPPISGIQQARIRNWIERRVAQAYTTLGDLIESDPEKCSGALVLRGTRFKIAQLLSELADGEEVAVLAEDLDLPEESLRLVLHSLSGILDQPMKE